MSSSAASSSTDDPAPAPPAPAPDASVADASIRSSAQRKQHASSPPSTDFRFYGAIAAVLAVTAIALSQVGPSFTTVVNFFWPLFLSTGVFLAAVAILRVISPPQADEDAADNAGADLMNFVAGGSAAGHEEHHEDVTAEEDKAEDRNGIEEEQEVVRR